MRNSVGTADVYNCTVADQHEFYANGILVHNSMDALRYALYSSDVSGGVATARASFGDSDPKPADPDQEGQTWGDVLPDPTQ